MAFIHCETCGERTTDKRSKCPKCGTEILTDIQKKIVEDKKRWEKNEELNRWARAEKKAGLSDQFVRCPNCEYQGRGKKFIAGSFVLEGVLWFLLFWTIIVPLIYSIWRLCNRKVICPVCDWGHVVPLSSNVSTPTPSV